MPATVADCMKARPATIRANQSVRAAAKLMNVHHTGYLVVTDRDRVVGVVTSHDILSRVFARGGTGDAQVRTACTPDPVTASPEDPAAAVAYVMRENGLHCMPVVRDGELTGLVTMADLAAAPEAGTALTGSEPSEVTRHLAQAQQNSQVPARSRPFPGGSDFN